MNVTKYAIAGSVVWSFILSLIFLLILRCCAGFIVFIILMAILAGFTILAIVFKSKENQYEAQGDDTYKTVMQVFFYIFVVLAIIWVIFIIVMCNRIRLAIALIEATAKYIHNNCCILFMPLIFVLISIIWYAYWIILSIFLYATGDLDPNSNVVASFVWTKKIRYSFWYHFLALLYIDATISALSQFIYASSACIWYFTHLKGTEEKYIRKSFYRAFRFHFGSLAFGALIIAIIRFIMILMEYIKKKLEATYGTKSKKGCCIKCIISCCECCMGCVSRTMEFINKHAYIQIACKGTNFCTSAWEGFGLLIRNLGRFSTLILLGTLFTYIGTLFISVSSSIIGYYVITKINYFNDKLNSVVLPVICFALIGLIIGLVTMSVFGMSSDAMMHAFLLDEELNKGQAKNFPELAKFMSDER